MGKALKGKVGKPSGRNEWIPSEGKVGIIGWKEAQSPVKLRESLSQLRAESSTKTATKQMDKS